MIGLVDPPEPARGQEPVFTVRDMHYAPANGLTAETDEDFITHAYRLCAIEFQTAMLAMTKTSNAAVKSPRPSHPAHRGASRRIAREVQPPPGFGSIKSVSRQPSLGLDVAAPVMFEECSNALVVAGRRQRAIVGADTHPVSWQKLRPDAVNQPIDSIGRYTHRRQPSVAHPDAAGFQS
jgi:hypothetical protein